MKRYSPFSKPIPPSAQPMTGQRKAPQPVGATEFTVTLTENRQKDGLELRFPSKPDDATLSDLKAHGWRWSRFSSCWYHRNIPENRTYANRYLTVAQIPQNVPSNTPVVASTTSIVPQIPALVSPGLTPEPSHLTPTTNILPVEFSPATAFEVTPQPPRPMLPTGPLPAWKLALLRR